MSEHIYKKIEVVGSSSNSIEEAINKAIGKTSQSLDNLCWFEVKEVRGAIDKDHVSEWQVGMNIAFIIKDT